MGTGLFAEREAREARRAVEDRRGRIRSDEVCVLAFPVVGSVLAEAEMALGVGMALEEARVKGFRRSFSQGFRSVLGGSPR